MHNKVFYLGILQLSQPYQWQKGLDDLSIQGRFIDPHSIDLILGGDSQ